MTCVYPEAVREAIERGRAAVAERAAADAKELAARRVRFNACLSAELGRLPVGAWLYQRVKGRKVSLGTRRCTAEFAGFPRQLFLDADLTADGCEPVGWRVWHLEQREDLYFPAADYAAALAAAAEPAGWPEGG